MLGKNMFGRIMAIIVILFIVARLANPGISQTVRLLAYQAFHKGAQLQLSFMTRNYESLEGQDFIIKYTAKDQDVAPLVLQVTQQYYQELRDKMGFNLPGSGKRLVVIYPDNVSLNKSFGWDKDQRAVGVYWAGSISILSPQEWLQGADRGEITAAFLQENPLTHELTHLLVDCNSNGNYPRWLTEGLAQYMEGEVTGYILPEPDPLPSTLIPIDRIDSSFDDENNQLAAYWQSRLMVNNLVQDYGLASVGQLLLLLQQGKSSQAAFQEVYGFTVDLLVDENKIFVKAVGQG